MVCLGTKAGIRSVSCSPERTSKLVWAGFGFLDLKGSHGWSFVEYPQAWSKEILERHGRRLTEFPAWGAQCVRVWTYGTH